MGVKYIGLGTIQLGVRTERTEGLSTDRSLCMYGTNSEIINTVRTERTVGLLTLCTYGTYCRIVMPS